MSSLPPLPSTPVSSNPLESGKSQASTSFSQRVAKAIESIRQRFQEASAEFEFARDRAVRFTQMSAAKPGMVRSVGRLGGLLVQSNGQAIALFEGENSFVNANESIAPVRDGEYRDAVHVLKVHCDGLRYQSTAGSGSAAYVSNDVIVINGCRYLVKLLPDSLRLEMPKGGSHV